MTDNDPALQVLLSLDDYASNFYDDLPDDLLRIVNAARTVLAMADPLACSRCPDSDVEHTDGGQDWARYQCESCGLEWETALVVESITILP